MAEIGSALRRAVVNNFYEFMDRGDYVSVGDLFTVPVGTEMRMTPADPAEFMATAPTPFPGLPPARAWWAPHTMTDVRQAGRGVGSELREGGRIVDLRVRLQRTDEGDVARDIARVLRHEDAVLSYGTEEVEVALAGTSPEKVERYVIPRIDEILTRRRMAASFRINGQLAQAG